MAPSLFCDGSITILWQYTILHSHEPGGAPVPALANVLTPVPSPVRFVISGPGSGYNPVLGRPGVRPSPGLKRIHLPGAQPGTLAPFISNIIGRARPGPHPRLKSQSPALLGSGKNLTTNWGTGPGQNTYPCSGPGRPRTRPGPRLKSQSPTLPGPGKNLTANQGPNPAKIFTPCSGKKSCICQGHSRWF